MDENHEAIGNANRDLLLSIISILVCLVAVLGIMVHDPAEKKADPPGQFSVSIVWDLGQVDVDLWMNAPGEKNSIGYSNKNGVVWDLLRDDTGNTSDAMPYNYENAYSRGMPAGDYTINLFCFHCTKVPVTVTFKLEQSAKTGMNLIYEKVITLTYQGEQFTVLNFHVDKNGVVSGINHVQKDLLRK